MRVIEPVRSLPPHTNVCSHMEAPRATPNAGPALARALAAHPRGDALDQPSAVTRSISSPSTLPASPLATWQVPAASCPPPP